MAIIFSRFNPDSISGRSLSTASWSFNSSDSASRPGLSPATLSTLPSGLSVSLALELSCSLTARDIPNKTTKRQIAKTIAKANTAVIT